MKKYKKTFGHEIENLVADFLADLPGIASVEQATEEEDQFAKVDLWVDFGDGCGRLGLQITTASNPQVLAKKERELRLWHKGVVFVQVPGREARRSLSAGRLSRAAGAAVVRQIWQGIGPARQRVLAAANGIRR